MRVKAVRKPDLFDDYFDKVGTGASPFLTPNARLWGKNTGFKAAMLAAVFLFFSFLLQQINFVVYSHILLAGVYFLVGIPSLIHAIEDVIELDINIDVLMTFAAFSSVLIGSPMEGALLLVLFDVSHQMEDMVSEKAKGAIASLHKLSPSRASVVQEDGTLLERSVKDIVVGETIFVKAGQVVPLDGVVVKGASSVNLVHLTGENLPVTKTEGNQVPAGARNLDGALSLRVVHSNADSTLSKIIELVTQAQEARPKLQRWFDSLSRRYATSIIVFSVLVAAILPFLTDLAYFGSQGSIYRALAFLIAASPCALILAIPIAYLSAVSSCARNGILVKGGVTLDALASCDVIAFDKTGTLTTGQLQCIDVASLDQQGNIEEALKIAHSLEQGAEHPIAKAILQLCKEKKIPPASITGFRSVPGYGVEANTEEGKKALIGSPLYIRPHLKVEEQQLLDQAATKAKRKGELLAALLVDSDLYLFRFQDTPRPYVADTIQELQSLGRYRLLMLTGDHKESAQMMAKEFRIQEFYSDLKPKDKLDHVMQLSKNQKLAMVGDGMNDAPALTRATVGISMGQMGTNAAIDAADVVLLQDNLERLGWLLRKSIKTQKIVRQNLLIAAGAILVATTPALLGLVPLWLAVILHEGGTVFVGLNALRLLGK